MELFMELCFHRNSYSDVGLHFALYSMRKERKFDEEMLSKIISYKQSKYACMYIKQGFVTGEEFCQSFCDFFR